MEKPRAGIAYKTPEIDWDMRRLGLGGREEILSLYRRQGFSGETIENRIASCRRQWESINGIIRMIPEAEIINVEDFKGKYGRKDVPDLLFVLGGDNFFQECTHYFGDSCFVSINSDPKTSVGALMYFDYDTLKPRLEDILKGDFRTEGWTRIACEINGKRIGDGTCTSAIYNSEGDKPINYLLSANGNEEMQKGTGLLVVSGAGSQQPAWYRNAGAYLPSLKSGLYPNPTAEFPKESSELKSLTREAFWNVDCRYKMASCTAWAGESISILYLANDTGVLSMDSVERYNLSTGDEIRFWKSERRLNVVSRDGGR